MRLEDHWLTTPALFACKKQSCWCGWLVQSMALLTAAMPEARCMVLHGGLIHDVADTEPLHRRRREPSSTRGWRQGRLPLIRLLKFVGFVYLIGFLLICLCVTLAGAQTQQRTLSKTRWVAAHRTLWSPTPVVTPRSTTTWVVTPDARPRAMASQRSTTTWVRQTGTMSK